MAKLYFRVASDWQEVVRLRQEIDKLKSTLKTTDSTQSPAAFKTLNIQLSEATKKMDDMVTEAAKAGAKIEGGFKKKIFDASQVVNGLTERIIAQKAVIKDVEADVKRLGETYRTALKKDPLRAGEKLIEYNSAKKVLDEEKAVLFGLTQQQAEARLSVKKLRDEYSLYKDEAEEVADVNKGLSISWQKALAVIGGGAMLKGLVSDMVRVRGEFQSMQTSIETMVGKDIAGSLIPQIKELAKISPLTMSDMVGAEQMMLGFNIQAKDTIKYLKALSDISMGESGKFKSLTLAFSQMSAAGKLMGQDLNQMINAGFNPLQIIAEKTGKSIATLKDEMSKGAISAEMVQQAFIDATSAGGKFYKMSENASKTINGQLSMMQDAIDTVYNELGTKSEGAIMKGIQLTTSLVKNYETIGKVLVGLVGTYGTYRTAIMLTTAMASRHTVAEIALTNARILARKAQLALNAAMLTNPYVAFFTVITGLVTTMWAFSDSTTAAERAQKRFNDEQEKASKKASEHKQRVDALLQSSRDTALADSEREESLALLRKEYPNIFRQYDIEALKLADILNIKRQIAEEDAKRANQKKNEDYTNAEKEWRDYSNFLSGKSANGERVTEKERNREAELRKYADQHLIERGKIISEQFISGLKDSDQKTLDKYKSELEKKIKGRGKNGSVKMRLPIGKGGELSDDAIYGIKDIEAIINAIDSAKDSIKNKTTYKQDFEKAKREWDEAKKKLSEIEKDKDRFTAKQYQEAKKNAEAKEKAYKDLGGLTGSALTKAAEKEKKQEQKSAEELLSIKRKRQQEEINLMEEGSEKKRRQVEHDYLVEMDAYEKAKEKHGETEEVKGMKSMADAKRVHGLSKVTEEEIEASREANERYLKEYGTFMQKRNAIESEYTHKISVATTQGDKDYLQKKMEEELKDLDIESLKNGLDWEGVFGNLDKVSSDTLKRLKSELKDFISTEKNLSPENMKELVEAIERIDSEIMDRNPFEAMSRSFESLKTATDKERLAQEKYNKALKDGTAEEKKDAASTLENAKDLKQKALYEATEALHKGVEEIGYYVDAGNEVLGIMEKLGINAPEWLRDTMAGFGEMLNGLETIDLTRPMSIVTGGLKTVKGALSTVLSLGGAVNWNGSNAKEVNESIDRLTSRNEALQTSIESLTDEMKASRGTKSVLAYRSAYDYQKEQNANYLKMAKEQARYHNSHKSWQYYMNWSDEDLRWIQQNVNSGFTGTSSLWSLTPEEMEKLRSNVDIWNKMQDAGKGGYGDRVTDRLDDYIEQAGKLEELTESLNESLTAISFDSMYDSFVNNLMDMKYDAKAAAEDISEYFMRAMLSNKIGEMYSDKLKKWWEKFAKSNEDNNMTEEERKALQDEYLGYVEEALKLRDELAAATGYDKISQGSSQQSTSRGFGSEMTHEDAGELSGRFTALQITGEEILSVNRDVRDIASETRGIIADSYLELVQISENTGAIVKPIIQMQKDIEEVKKNTSRL